VAAYSRAHRPGARSAACHPAAVGGAAAGRSARRIAEPPVAPSAPALSLCHVIAVRREEP